MQSSELISTLRKIIPAADSKNVISALRQDPLIWDSLMDEAFLRLVTDKSRSEKNVFQPSELALLAVNIDKTFPNDQANKTDFIDDDLNAQSREIYAGVLASGKIPDSLKEAGLIAIGIREKNASGTSWIEISKEIFPKSSMTFDHALKLWRTPLTILFGMVPDRMAFLQALLPERGSKTSFEWISHIILSNPMAFQDQVKILFVLMAHLPLGARVGWLIILNRFGKKELVIELAKMILAARTNPDENFKKELQTNHHEDDLAIHVVESQYMATLQQLANNPDGAKELIDLASEQLKEWMQNLDMQKNGIGGAEAKDLILDSPILEDENPVLQIMKTGALKSDAPTNLEKIREAVGRLIGLIQTDPESIFPRYALGWEPTQIIKKLEDLDFHREAMECISGFIKLRPSDIALIAKAVTLCSKMEDYPAAVEYAGLLVLLEPENLNWGRLLVEQYSLNGDLLLAMDEQQDILARNALPEIGDWLTMADLALKAGNLEKAMDACNAVLAAEPENALALGHLGKAYMEKGDIDQAIQYLSRATLIAPEMDMPWLNLVEALRRKNEPEKAYDSLRSAVLASPHSPMINFELAKACLEKGAKAEALPYLKKAAKLLPDSLPVVLELVKALGELGHAADAKEIIESSRTKWPGQPELAYAHAGILQEDGDQQAAIRAYEIAIEGKPGQLEWIIGYAESLLGDNGDFILGKNKVLSQASLKSAREAIERSDGISDSRREILLAELNLASGNYDEAFKIYQKLKDMPSDCKNEWLWRMQTGLAKAALALGQNDVALVALAEAIKEKPELKELYQMQAEAFIVANLNSDAAKTAGYALELDPDEIENIIWHAKTMMKIGSNDEAAKSLSKALEMNPERTDLLIKLAEAQFCNGNQDRSRKGLEEILDLGCTDEGELEQGARIALEMGDQQLALSFLERAVALDAGSYQNIRPVLAGLYRNIGDLPTALVEIQTAIESYPNEARLYVFQADLLQNLGRFQAALSSLEQASKVLSEQRIDEIIKIPKSPIDQFLPGDWTDVTSIAAISLMQMKIYKELGDYSSALSSAENTLRENPGDFILRMQIIRLAFEALLDQRVFDLADYSSFVSSDESGREVGLDQIRHSFPSLTSLRANILIDRDDFTQADQIIESALTISQDEPTLLFTKARILRHQGRPSDAAQIFEKGLSLENELTAQSTAGNDTDPLNTWVFDGYLKAETALDLNQWSRAAEFFNEYLEEFPNSPRAHLGKVKLMVVAAEFQCIAQLLKINAHSAQDLLPYGNGFEIFSKEISQAKQDTESLLSNRWQARGRAVFKLELDAIKSLAALPKNSEDASALIASLRDTKNIQAVLQVAQKFPENAKVIGQLAINLMPSNPESAQKAIEKVLTLEPESPVYLSLGALIAEKNDDFNMAAEYLSQALAIWPDEPEWQAWAARLNEKIGQTDKAVHHWEQVMVLCPDELTPAIALGETYLRNKDYEKAATILEGAKKLDPNSPKIYLALAGAYIQQERFQLALENAVSAGQLDINSAEPLIICGKISREMKDMQKAQDFADSALNRQPEDMDAILFSSEIAEERKGPDAALALLEKMVKAGNVSNGIQIARSSLLRKAGKKAEAFTEIKKLAIDETDDANILAELAKSQAEMGYLLDAIETANKALKIDPENSEMHLLIGTHQGRSGQLDLAIHHLIDAVRIDQKSIDGYLELGEMYQQRREYNLARKVYQDAIKANPRDARLHYHLALALKEAKDFAGSEAMLRKAAELDPQDLKIRRQLGAVIALNLVQNAQEVNQIS